MAHDVFLSYSSRDKPIADAVCAHLEGAGIRVWVAPRDVLPGKIWGEAIIDAINGSRVMVVVFSASSNGSQQVLREVERAVAKGIGIIPFRVEAVQPSKSMEYFLSSPHWLDAIDPPVERHIASLVASVTGLLHSLGAAPPSGPVAASGADKTPAPPPAAGENSLDDWYRPRKGLFGRLLSMFDDK